ncbi:LysR family transcriptional regulator [Pseudoroseomonas wenyumeiae]
MTVFVTVVREGSLSGAARVLGLTPSAVSRIVARIEARLGVQLVIRTTRSFRLTSEGEAYARSSRRILDDIADSRVRSRIRGARAVACASAWRWRMDGWSSCHF